MKKIITIDIQWEEIIEIDESQEKYWLSDDALKEEIKNNYQGYLKTVHKHDIKEIHIEREDEND